MSGEPLVQLSVEQNQTEPLTSDELNHSQGGDLNHSKGGPQSLKAREQMSGEPLETVPENRSWLVNIYYWIVTKAIH